MIQSRLVRAAEADQVKAFDLGPGNMLIDGAVVRFSGGGERYDRDGRRAAAGQVDPDLLARLMSHDFLQLSPPKSTGREEFGEEFLKALLQQTGLSADDLLATLTAFTAAAIVDGINRFVLPEVQMDELWISGGGVHNLYLVQLIEAGLPGLQVASLEGLGYSPDAREALTFAVLANETLMGHAGNLPSATGACTRAVLGKVVLGHIF